jgi:hypothetical protein
MSGRAAEVEDELPPRDRFLVGSARSEPVTAQSIYLSPTTTTVSGEDRAEVGRSQGTSVSWRVAASPHASGTVLATRSARRRVRSGARWAEPGSPTAEGSEVERTGIEPVTSGLQIPRHG